MSFLDFDRVAAARGDGLLPELRALLERRARLAHDPNVSEINGNDTGRPMPRTAGGAFVAGNVVPIDTRPNPQRVAPARASHP